MLEALSSLTIDSGVDRIAPVGVRTVAAALGVAPNTAHRALRTLERLGLIVPMEQGRAHRGRFGTAGYRVDVPADALAIEPPNSPDVAKHGCPTSRVANPSPFPAARPKSPEVEQLELLPRV